MYPEGDPTSMASQEILFWQFRTMETMYHKIGLAIQANKRRSHPTDYLSFYCLGKRESSDALPVDLDDPEPESAAKRLRKTLRHPIYVHCKMSIFDDFVSDRKLRVRAFHQLDITIKSYGDFEIHPNP